MAILTVGSIVAIKFPFSDLSSAKLRPALIVGRAEFGNYIVCQVTSRSYTSKLAVHIAPNDTEGMLIKSYIRPDKIFTADPSLVLKHIATLSPNKIRQVKNALRGVLEL